MAAAGVPHDLRSARHSGPRYSVSWHSVSKDGGGLAVEARRSALEEGADPFTTLVTRGAGGDLFRLRIQMDAEICRGAVTDQALDPAEGGGGPVGQVAG